MFPENKPQATQNKPSKKLRNRFSGLFGFIGLLFWAGVIATFINLFVFQTYQVVGQSMEPTLSQNDYLIVSKIEKSFERIGFGYTPKRGEIVIFNSPERNNFRLVKRVIALPGERVLIRDGQVLVFNDERPSGFNPDEGTSYGDKLHETSGNVDLIVPKGEVFVLGDNRSSGGSLDSRSEKVGPVRLQEVIGELVLRVFPFDQAKFF